LQDLVAEPVADIAVIGGSGFYSFFDSGTRALEIDTPFGRPSSAISIGTVAGRPTAFLPRHGVHHEFPPHMVPYRANLWALRSLGVRRVFAPCAAGSLSVGLQPGSIVVPDQLVDRTSGRRQTYFDVGAVHVPFADPFCPDLRVSALQSGTVDGGTMVVVEGPRFSTRAESTWYAAQGWSLVNMTAHPEAVLARELELCFATIALVTDLDAGIDRGDGVRAQDVFAEFERNIGHFKELIRQAVGHAPSGSVCPHCAVHAGTTLPFELP
jgi:5'-methylthioadenosine phosphorylase